MSPGSHSRIETGRVTFRNWLTDLAIIIDGAVGTYLELSVPISKFERM